MLEIPMPSLGKFMELVAVYRAQGHTAGTVPVANDRGEIIEVELSQH